MEEAAAELRAAVDLALNLEPACNGLVGDELLHHDIHAHHGSSEPSYISSLSGSLPSERSGAALAASRRRNYYAAHGGREGEGSDGSGSRQAWRRRRLEVAARLENAVSNCEVAVYNLCNDGVPSQVNELGGDGHELGTDANCANDIVDQLVAVLTSVPRSLLQQPTSVGEGVHSPQEEEEYLASLEQIYFNTTCGASDVIRRYFLNPMPHVDSLPMLLEDRHILGMVDEVMHLCEADQSTGVWPINVDPLVGILNSLSEGMHVERAMQEREGCADVAEDGYQSQFADLSSKDALRLVHTLVYRYLCEKEQEHEGSAVSSQICYFASHLLAHFASMAADETGRNSSEEHTAGLFEAWADGIDEQMERRLNDEEAREVYDLVVRYHVGSIQSALHSIEIAESLVSDAISNSEENVGIGDDTVEAFVAALQDAIRQMATVVTTTEAMERLNLQHDPEIHLIFYPLIMRLARFNASCLHDAMILLRKTCGGTNDCEELSILADDLLFRVCRVSVGLDFLRRSTETGEEEEVLAISLLRAMDSQCIVGKAGFLLDIAADRARMEDEEEAANDAPESKRQRYSLARFGSGQLPPPNRLCKADGSSNEERRGETTEIILACLALSRPVSVEAPNPSSVRHASSVASALMFSNGEEGVAEDVLDPLNPWHTLQVKPLQKLVDTADSSHDDDEGVLPSESLRAFAQSMPHLSDTNSPPSAQS
ncbi:hypothetical protein ACHAXT_011540 [Thalassiosira profunda]